MAGYETYLGTAFSKYRYPDITNRDVLNVIQTFTDLRPKLEDFVFNDGSRKELLCLDGTIPVIYQGMKYNIPVCIWLADTHPYNPPMLFVKPASNMQIKAGKHVDPMGKIFLPYLHEWKHPSSDLPCLIRILVIQFEKEMPLFAKSSTLQRHAQEKAGNEAYLEIALAKYRYPDITIRDVLNAIQTFTSLRPKLENFVFNDGSRKELLCLDGTIPVIYQGMKYNIPVCIWLADTHPYNPPMLFVKPASNMQIKAGKHVDPMGKIFLPYLHEWKHPSSDLPGLIRILVIQFEKETPVVAKSSTPEGHAQEKAGNEAYLEIALAKYRNPDITKRDALNVIQTFTDLRPKLDDFVFNDGSRKELLCLDGTIPVIYQGTKYNIPVCIWLADTHPYNAPMLFVKPASNMQIKAGKHVDQTGKIFLPYLHEWKHPSSDLSGLIRILVIQFEKETPVVAKSGTPEGSGQSLSSATRRDAMPVLQESMSSLIECSICLETLTDPRMLTCLHTFCKKCLQDHIDSSAMVNQNGQFQCPVCRQPLEVPSARADAFPKNFFINSYIAAVEKAGGSKIKDQEDP